MPWERFALIGLDEKTSEREERKDKTRGRMNVFKDT